MVVVLDGSGAERLLLDHQDGRGGEAGGGHELFLQRLIDADLTGAYAAAGVGDAGVFELFLELPVLAVLAMEGQEGHVDQVGEFIAADPAADLIAHCGQVQFALRPQAFLVDLKAVRTFGGQSHRREEITDAAPVEVRPVEQVPAAVAVDEDGDGRKQPLVQVIVDGAPPGKGDLTLPGRTAEEDAHSDAHTAR